MKRYFLVSFTLSALVLFLSLHARSQTPVEEVSRLKEHLGLTPDSVVKLGTPSEYKSDGNVLKVFLAMGLDLKVRENFVRNIEKWNSSGDANKYCRIEIVDNISLAKIILSRYTLNELARSNSGSNTVPSTVWDPATNSTVTRPTQRAYSYTTVPVYAYVILNVAGEFKIVSRYSGSAAEGESRRSGGNLWDDFKRVIKKK